LYYQIGNLSPLLTTQESLLEFHSTRNMDAKGNSCTIKLNNPIVDFFSNGIPRCKFTNTTGVINFQAATPRAGFTNFEERIEFYAKHTDDIGEDPVNDENVLFSGQIMAVKVKASDKESSIELSCGDRTFNILNRIAPNDYASTRVPNIIQDVVRTFTEYDSSELAYSLAGVLGKGPAYKYPIDARLFSEGIKQSTTAVSATATKTITAASATFITNGVEVGDLVRNMTTNRVAIVKEVVSETSLVISKAIFTSAANIQVSNGFIQDFRPDGTQFPLVSFGYGKKPLYEWISTLSQEEYTNFDIVSQENYIVKRPMMFYVDGKNRLHWFLPDDIPSHEISVGVPLPIGQDTQVHQVYDYDLEKTVFDIVNFIIFDCGKDMDGAPITWYAQDPYAGGIIVRDSYRLFQTISAIMKRDDFVAGNLSYQGDENYTVTASYPFVPAWDRQARSCPDLATYKSRFRDEALWRGLARAMAIIKKTANPRWRGKVTLRGENFSPSDLVLFTDLSKGIFK